MRFRNLLAAVGVFAVCMVSLSAFAYGETSRPAVFVRGLVMLQLEQKDGLQIVLPDAPGHKATITVVMTDGKRQVFPFKGHSAIIGSSNPDAAPASIKVPEVVRMRELYGLGITPLVDRVANKVSIPWGGIRAIRTEQVTDSRYTFVRKDNGLEIESFRPRNIAESIRIELTSLETLDLKTSKADIDVANVKEIWVEHVPTDMAALNAYREHFHHYLHYIGRPAGKEFDVEPKKLSGGVSYVPPAGNSFRLGLDVLCGPAVID